MHKEASQSHSGDAGLICFKASRRAQMENSLPFILLFSFGQSIRDLSSSVLVWSVRVTSQAETPHLHSFSPGLRSGGMCLIFGHILPRHILPTYT